MPLTQNGYTVTPNTRQATAMWKDWSLCTFNRAQNTSGRVIALLLRDCQGNPQAQLDEEEELVQLLRALGPECQSVVAQCKTPGSHDRNDLAERLCAIFQLAEAKQPVPLDALEQYLFKPVCQETILSEELNEIGRLRTARKSGVLPPDSGKASARARRANLCGLALSGGGVRSATFNLGLLQGMAKHGVLPAMDYLSMVSGGGYIGGWLTAWIKRDGFEPVMSALADERSDPRGATSRPLAFLREYASYLTPRNGLFSIDTWTALMIWGRNTFLNLIILISGLSALLLLPRFLKSCQILLQGWLRHFQSHYPEESLTVVAVLCEIIIIFHAARNLKGFRTDHEDEKPNVARGFGYSPRKIQAAIILPALIAAGLGSARLWGFAVEVSIGRDVDWFVHISGLGVMVGACFVLLAWLQWRGGFIECYMRERRKSLAQVRIARTLCILLPLLVAAIKAGLLVGIFSLYRYVYYAWPCTKGTPCTRDTLAVTCGTPLMLLVFAICLYIHIGLMGRNLPDDRREWWSRIAAYLSIYAAAISSLFFVAFFGKNMVSAIAGMPKRWISAVALWTATTAAGLFFAQRTGRDKKDPEGNRKLEFTRSAFLALSPMVFVTGLFVVLSASIELLFNVTEPYLRHVALGRLAGLDNSYISNPLVVFFDIVVLLMVMFGFSSTVDINEFSMHHFYRNRLIRAYLGASHCTERRPNRLTGFDRADDLPMASLRPERELGLREGDYGRPYTGPYPVFNAALNLVNGERLAWQERKAASFIFTPQFCGYDYQPITDTPLAPPLHNAGFRPTSVYAYPDGGIHIGTAMAISGAALTPNAGFHTSTPLAVLLTVFNVRLGWWMGNPRNDRSWQRSGPRFGLVYLLNELFGWSNDRKRQIYLSDGGHFDNLGIYELVRRRCSLIIASDAEEDADWSFHGLGSVIRKCFVDFGARIDIDLEHISPNGENVSRDHFAIGRIYYPEGWSGTFLYIKTSLTGDEPADLREYMARRRTFPNQPTADQFFEESEFESYHRLGLHIAKSAFGPGNTAEEREATIKIRERDWTQDEAREAPAFWTAKATAAAAGNK